MIVVPPNLFENWKKVILEDDKLSSLDKEMKSILYDKKINNIDKWNMYKHSLMSYARSMRNNKYFLNENKNNFTKILEQKSVQTDEPEIMSSKYLPRKSLQQNLGNSLEFNQEEIFSSSVNKNNNNNESIQNVSAYDLTHDNIDNSENSFQNSSLLSNKRGDVYETPVLDCNTRNLELEALAVMDQPKHVKIRRERMSMNPDEYRTYELSNNEIVNLPVLNKIEDKQMITRSKVKKMKQTSLSFRKTKKVIDKNKSQSKKRNNHNKSKNISNKTNWVRL